MAGTLTLTTVTDSPVSAKSWRARPSSGPKIWRPPVSGVVAVIRCGVRSGMGTTFGAGSVSQGSQTMVEVRSVGEAKGGAKKLTLVDGSTA